MSKRPAFTYSGSKVIAPEPLFCPPAKIPKLNTNTKTSSQPEPKVGNTHKVKHEKTNQIYQNNSTIQKPQEIGIPRAIEDSASRVTSKKRTKRPKDANKEKKDRKNVDKYKKVSQINPTKLNISTSEIPKPKLPLSIPKVAQREEGCKKKPSNYTSSNNTLNISNLKTNIHGPTKSVQSNIVEHISPTNLKTIVRFTKSVLEKVVPSTKDTKLRSKSSSRKSSSSKRPKDKKTLEHVVDKYNDIKYTSTSTGFGNSHKSTYKSIVNCNKSFSSFNKKSHTSDDRNEKKSTLDKTFKSQEIKDKTVHKVSDKSRSKSKSNKETSSHQIFKDRQSNLERRSSSQNTKRSTSMCNKTSSKDINVQEHKSLSKTSIDTNKCHKVDLQKSNIIREEVCRKSPSRTLKLIKNDNKIVRKSKQGKFAESAVTSKKTKTKASEKSENNNMTQLKLKQSHKSLKERLSKKRYKNLKNTVPSIQDNETESDSEHPLKSYTNVKTSSSNSVKYKKINIVINVSYKQANTSSESLNDSQDKEDESNNLTNTDISFLDDINIDEIINSLEDPTTNSKLSDSGIVITISDDENSLDSILSLHSLKSKDGDNNNSFNESFRSFSELRNVVSQNENLTLQLDDRKTEQITVENAGPFRYIVDREIRSDKVNDTIITEKTRTCQTNTTQPCVMTTQHENCLPQNNIKAEPPKKKNLVKVAIVNVKPIKEEIPDELEEKLAAITHQPIRGYSRKSTHQLTGGDKTNNAGDLLSVDSPFIIKGLIDVDSIKKETPDAIQEKFVAVSNQPVREKICQESTRDLNIEYNANHESNTYNQNSSFTNYGIFDTNSVIEKVPDKNLKNLAAITNQSLRGFTRNEIIHEITVGTSIKTGSSKLCIDPLAVIDVHSIKEEIPDELKKKLAANINQCVRGCTTKKNTRELSGGNSTKTNNEINKLTADSWFNINDIIDVDSIKDEVSNEPQEELETVTVRQCNTKKNNETYQRSIDPPLIMNNVIDSIKEYIPDGVLEKLAAIVNQCLRGCTRKKNTSELSGGHSGQMNNESNKFTADSEFIINDVIDVDEASVELPEKLVNNISKLAQNEIVFSKADNVKPQSAVNRNEISTEKNIQQKKDKNTKNVKTILSKLNIAEKNVMNQEQSSGSMQISSSNTIITSKVKICDPSTSQRCSPQSLPGSSNQQKNTDLQLTVINKMPPSVLTNDKESNNDKHTVNTKSTGSSPAVSPKLHDFVRPLQRSAVKHTVSFTNETVTKPIYTVINDVQPIHTIVNALNDKHHIGHSTIKPPEYDEINKNNIKEGKTEDFCALGFIDKCIALKLEERMLEYLQDEFKVLSVVKRGTFSVIYKCKDSLGRSYAAKVLKAQHQQYTYGINKEKILWQLQKDVPKNKLNFVYLFNGFAVLNRWCFLLEYYPMNLKQAFDENKVPFHINTVQILARQLVSAVAVLRTNNIVHSDIKPAHIMINNTHTKLKLCGFDRADIANNHVLIPNMGKVNYRAPEIILGHSAGFSIDVWSTALVMYEMATNVILFPAVFNNDLLFQQMCAMGQIPIEMINNSLFKKNHFVLTQFGVRFKRKIGRHEQDVQLLASIDRSQRLESTLRFAYSQHSAFRMDKRQKDMAKLDCFQNLLMEMLVLDPNHRIPIMHVLAHPFIHSNETVF